MPEIKRDGELRRRQSVFLAAGALVSAWRPVYGQAVRRTRRIGYLTLSSVQSNAPWLAAFREGMKELGWLEGRDYVLDARYADGVAQALPTLAGDLVAALPDLLLTTGEQAIFPLIQKTRAIPVVFTIAFDPVAIGIVASLKRPGGNATGLTTLGRDVQAKQLQLLKEAFPRTTHVGVLFDPGTTSTIGDIEEAARRLGLRTTLIEMQQAVDIAPAFERGAALGAQAYFLLQSGVVNSQCRAFADHAIRLKAPSMGPNSEYVESGGLMSYGTFSRDNFRRRGRVC